MGEEGMEAPGGQIVEQARDARTTKLVATLGMFILDTFIYEDQDARPAGGPSDLQIGGAGTYGKLSPKYIRCIVDRGHDFPQSAQKTIDTFGSGMWIVREDASRGTTTAANIYRKSGRRDFEYLSDRRRLRFSDLLGPDPSSQSPEELPAYVHIVCYAWRLAELVGELDELAERWPNLKGWTPRLIYEPMPDTWSPTELDAIAGVAKRIYCISPNHDEAAAFFGIKPLQIRDMVNITDLTHRLCSLGCSVGIIRSGAMGACVAMDDGQSRWIKPMVTDPAQVVDVTGCGNAFLGGYMAGLANGLDDFQAAERGTISAGLTLLQYGLPVVSSRDGAESWSDVGTTEDLLRGYHGEPP